MQINFCYALEMAGVRGHNFDALLNQFLSKKTYIDQLLKIRLEGTSVPKDEISIYNMVNFLKEIGFTDFSETFNNCFNSRDYYYFYTKKEETILKFRKEFDEVINLINNILKNGIADTIGIVDEVSLEKEIKNFGYFGLIRLYSELPDKLKNNIILEKAIIDSYKINVHFYINRYIMLPNKFKGNKEILTSTINLFYTLSNEEINKFYDLSKLYLLKDYDLLKFAIERSRIININIIKYIINKGKMNIDIALLAIEKVRSSDILNIFLLLPREIQNEKSIALKLLNILQGKELRIYTFSSKEIQNHTFILISILKKYISEKISYRKVIDIPEIAHQSDTAYWAYDDKTLIYETIIDQEEVSHMEIDNYTPSQVIDIPEITHQSDTAYWAYNDKTLIYEIIINQKEVSHTEIVNNIDNIIKTIKIFSDNIQDIIFKYIENNFQKLYLSIKNGI